MTTAAALRSRHLLGIAKLDPPEIDLILETVHAVDERLELLEPLALAGLEDPADDGH